MALAHPPTPGGPGRVACDDVVVDARDLRRLDAMAAETFEVHARTDVLPRPLAQSEFVRQVRGGRAMRSVVAGLLADGYEVIVTAPDGTAFPGAAVPPLGMMDADLGYSPRPEFADRMEFRHGTWLLRPHDHGTGTETGVG